MTRAFAPKTSSLIKEATKNVALSQRYGQEICAEPKRCWYNSLKLVRKLGKHKDDYLYVEGFVRLRRNGLVIEHGWLEDKVSGEIIDPTIHADDMDYFAGKRYTLEQVRSMGKKPPPFVWGGEGGFGGFRHADYKKAYTDAWGGLLGEADEVDLDELKLRVTTTFFDVGPKNEKYVLNCTFYPSRNSIHEFLNPESWMITGELQVELFDHLTHKYGNVFWTILGAYEDEGITPVYDVKLEVLTSSGRVIDQQSKEFQRKLTKLSLESAPGPARRLIDESSQQLFAKVKVDYVASFSPASEPCSKRVSVVIPIGIQDTFHWDDIKWWGFAKYEAIAEQLKICDAYLAELDVLKVEILDGNMDRISPKELGRLQAKEVLS